MDAWWALGYEGRFRFLSAIGPCDETAALHDAVRAYSVTRDLGPEGIGPTPDDVAAAIEQARATNAISPALDGLLQTLDTAKTALVEHGYFDLDARSEEVYALAVQYRFGPVLNDRLHFFDVEVSRDQFEAALISNEELKYLQDHYLGYTVFRQENTKHIVGRTMIAPPRREAGLAEPRDFALRIRTRVREHLSLMGRSFTIEAVPFIQQDGGLTRCAHANAWMAHYTAVLRGLVPRVPIAELHSPLESSDALGQRQYPSPGLTDVQLSLALSHAGLPAEVKLIDGLRVQDTTAWHHNPDLQGTDRWYTEAFTTTICRYLNSGIPVLLTRYDHVRMICGYLRASQLSGGSSSNALTHFVLADDGQGPYRIESVDSLLYDKGDEDLLLVPLPPGLYLYGESAEGLGAGFLRGGVDTALLEATEKGDEALAASLRVLAARMDAHELAIRTYAIESNVFKKSFLRRFEDPQGCAVVLESRLPKYVWVCELIDREERRDAKQGTGPVLGEVVIDGTAVRPESAEALCLHLPGYISILDKVSQEESSFLCEAKFYPSGRWAHDQRFTEDLSLAPDIGKTMRR